MEFKLTVNDDHGVEDLHLFGLQPDLNVQTECVHFVVGLVHRLAKLVAPTAAETYRVGFIPPPLPPTGSMGLLDRHAGAWPTEARSLDYERRGVRSSVAFSKRIVIREGRASAPLQLTFDNERQGALCHIKRPVGPETTEAVVLGAHGCVPVGCAFYYVLCRALVTRFVINGAVMPSGRWSNYQRHELPKPILNGLRHAKGAELADATIEAIQYLHKAVQEYPDTPLELSDGLPLIATDFDPECLPPRRQTEITLIPACSPIEPEQEDLYSKSQPVAPVGRANRSDYLITDAQFELEQRIWEPTIPLLSTADDLCIREAQKRNSGGVESAPAVETDDRKMFMAKATALALEQHLEEATAVLNDLAARPAPAVARASEMTLRGLIRYRSGAAYDASRYLREASRLLGEPFRDLSCAARIAHYDALLTADRGRVVEALGGLERARGLYECALTTEHRRVSDGESETTIRQLELELAQVDNSLGNLALARGELERARRCADRSIALKERWGDLHGLAFSEGLRARVHGWMGHFEAAKICMQRALRLNKASSDSRGYAVVLVDAMKLRLREALSTPESSASLSKNMEFIEGRLKEVLVGVGQEVKIEAAIALFRWAWQQGMDERIHELASQVFTHRKQASALQSALILGIEALIAKDNAVAEELSRQQAASLESLEAKLEGLEWSVLRCRSFLARNDIKTAQIELDWAIRMEIELDATCYLHPVLRRLEKRFNTDHKGSL